MLNIVVLHGRVSRPAEERALPSGDRLATFDVTVPDDAAKAASVPLAWFDPPGWIFTTEVDAELVVVGRVRRRFFRSGTSLQSRTEVVVESAVPARRAARAAEVLAKAASVVRDEQVSTGRR